MVSTDNDVVGYAISIKRPKDEACSHSQQPADMSTHSEHTESGRAAPKGAAAAPAGTAPLHPRSFKLRFATQCESGRSHFSAVKPLSLPRTVTDKPQRRERGEAGPAEAARLRRVQDAFRRGPRDKYAAPLTTSHEYGWWAERGAAAPGERWLRHHIRDSAWLKERVRVLATDAGYKR